MTIENLDIQPTLRSPHVSVRGGRLTKFKGRVASLAPGLLVVVTAALLFSGSEAHAVDECGVDLRGQTNLTCNSSHSQAIANGITYTNTDGLNLTLPKNPGLTVVGSGVRVHGQEGHNRVHMLGGSVDATGGSHGLHVELETTETTELEVLARIRDGNIEASGASAHGLWAISNGNGRVEVLVEGGTVTSGSHAAIAEATGNAKALVKLSGNGHITTTGDNAMAIFSHVSHVESGAEVIAIVEGTTEITTEGKGAHGVLASNKGGGDALVQMKDGKVTTGGEDALGLWADARGGGNATVEMSGGRVINNGTDPDNQGVAGLNATIGDRESGATAKVLMTGDAVIETTQKRGYGIRANTQGTGKAHVRMEGGSITTMDISGNDTYGIWAEATNSTREGAVAEALVEMTGGKVETNSDNAYALVASNNGGGRAAMKVKVEGGTVTTKGKEAHGLYAWIFGTGGNGNAARAEIIEGDAEVEIKTTGDKAHGVFANQEQNGDAIAQMSGGTIITEGQEAHGLNAFAATKMATVELSAGGTVMASGAGADGIRAQGATGFDIEVAGDVTGGAGNGAAIRTISSKTGEIDIVSGANVNAGGSGIAIRTETAAAGGDGVPIAGVDDGTAVIRSAGNIKGDIELDAGDDTLIVTGGSITGDVYGSQGDNTLRLERGRFTGDIRFVAGDNSVEMEDGRFTGGIYGGAGNDTVTISADATYVGSHVLDGGAGGNDQLTLHGQTISNTAENFRNWERVTLNDTNLRLAGVARLDIDQLSINAGSAFRASGGGGGITIAGDVINNGSVVLSVQDGAADDVITIEGDYTGSGRSVVALDAVLAGNDANTDQLVITGDMSGEMMLSIAGLDSIAPTGAPLEIDVVTVGGESGGTFTLMGGNHVTADGEHGVISGAHLYRLAETGRGWALSALSSTGGRNWQPSAPIYDSYGQSLLALNGPASLRSRGSSEDFRSLAWDGGSADQNRDTPLWFQMGGERITSSEEHSTTGAALESSIWEMEIGGDVVVSESGAGLLVGGLQFSYATGSASVSSEFGDGSIDTSGFGLGLAATWYDHRRFYVDGQVSLASYSSDLEADRIGTLTDGNGGTGLAFSIEAGQQLDLGSSLTVIPQAQLSLSSVAFDDFEGERYGEQVTLEDAASQQLRLGLEFGAQEQGAHRLYGIVNLFHEFGAGSEVNVAGASLTTESEPWAIGVGLGGNYALTDRVDLFGEASYATGLSNAGDASALSANAGLKVVF